jgi:hypothetical protein
VFGVNWFFLHDLRADPHYQAERVSSDTTSATITFSPNYRQIAAYWHKLDRESDRMIVQEICKTAEGRPHLMAIVTSPENHRKIWPAIGRFRAA